jgi:valyl-tRNA synthetase
VVKVTPAHDPNDYAVWQRHQGKPDEIGIINILNPQGTINSNGGKYADMKRDAARKKVVEDLTALGLLEKEEPYETQVGHSDRSKTPIEPYLSDQWFVKMAPLAEPALEVVRNGTIKFFPERHAQQYLAWLGEKRDWPISRQLWWGHRIPVWTFQWGMDHDAEFRAKSETLLEQERAIRLVKLKRFFEIAGVADQIWISPQPDSPNYFLCTATERAEEIVRKFVEVVLEERRNPRRIPHDAPSDDRVLAKEKWRAFGQEVYDASYDLPPIIFKMHETGIADAQDPDVLDTWFSSALWPHSTLGWPEETPELKKYYPTSVLLTGRDIITLWVARMVMTGLYNMGQGSPDSVGWASPTTSAEEDGQCPPYKSAKPSPSPSTQREGRGEGSSAQSSVLGSTALAAGSPQSLTDEQRRALGKRLGIPFLDVAINPTILDGKGERMSKSKGNGVDPVEIIDTHGADALRFTLTLMATETQDARLPVKKDAQGRNTSEKFDIGRNFANKLWNAARFTLSNLESIAPEPVDESKWSMIDRWIVGRFNAAVAEADAALESYRFDQYAKVCYDFFWRDFCDWYVEAVKPSLKGPAKSAQSANVLAAVLDGTLRLLHPMVPFITETIWWHLNEVRPQRGLPGRLDCPPSARLILAAWPKASRADATDSAITTVQDFVTAIRNIRNTHKVPPPRVLSVVIVPAGAPSGLLRDNLELIQQFANCRIALASAPINGAVRVSVDGCDVFVEGIADEGVEQERESKRIDELTKLIATLNGRLSNAGYIAKAPPHLVEQTKQQLAEAEAELAKLRGK